jgi:N-acetylmuramoyl-L-alanine amidase
MRALWLPDVLRDAGLTIRLVDGWETRGNELSSVIGVVGHHTVSNPPANNPSLNVCINGRPDLKGPLCQLLLARDGSYDVIAAGEANHAGSGSWPGWPSSANDNTIGIEAENNGTGEWWSAAIMDSFAEGCAAILEYIGKDKSAFITHYEWAGDGRKIDPRGPWVQGGGGEDWWSGNYDVNDRSADAFRMRIGACMGMTAAQEAKLDRVLTMLDSFFGIDEEGNAKDIRKKLDAVYVEVADENHSDTLGGRVVDIEHKINRLEV